MGEREPLEAIDEDADHAKAEEWRRRGVRDRRVVLNRLAILDRDSMRAAFDMRRPRPGPEQFLSEVLGDRSADRSRLPNELAKGRGLRIARTVRRQDLGGCEAFGHG